MKKRIKDSDFYGELKELDNSTIILKKYGQLVLIVLFSSIISCGIYGFFSSLELDNNKNFEIIDILIIITIVLVFIGVYLLYEFSRIREKGLIIYEEITDEIDWSKDRKNFIHRPALEIRVLIREFLKASDLPFTIGKIGQTYYLSLFILVLFSIILIKIFF
uniref:hypothetical protein n=1 Tax=Gelidibacter sp. TaxID=2018083 RepID=UPI00404A4060